MLHYLPWIAPVLLWIGGMVMFKDPADIEKNLSGWRARVHWIASWGTEKWWRKPVAAILFIVGGAVVGTLFQSWWDEPRPMVVKSEFQQAHNQYPQLGPPLDEARLATLPNKKGNGIVQSLFDNAWLLWLDNPGILYAIPTRNAAQPYVAEDDTFSGGPLWPNKNEEIRSRPAFAHIDASCKLPTGGFLISWDRDPKAWGWIGCGEWYCLLDGSNIYYQDFEGGRIIGPMRLERKYNEAAQMFVLLKDGKHYAVRSPEAPPPVRSCEY